MTKAIEVAKYFIEKTKKEKSGEKAVLSPLKLQKLLYYAQGWHLGINDEPIFDDKICAWKYGPVVRTVYDELKRYGSDNLRSVYEQNTDTDLSEDTRLFLNRVWNTYATDSARALVSRTHISTPWLIAIRDPYSDVITERSMKEHFRKLV